MLLQSKTKHDGMKGKKNNFLFQEFVEKIKLYEPSF